MSSAWMYTLIPAAAAVLGAVAAVNIRPGPRIVSAIQHLAAGVVFAAAAGEILPDLMHRNAPVATVVGGGIALAVMLAIKQVEGLVKGPLGLLSMVGVDILIDGLVLGIGFSAGAKAGILLTVALTLEVLFLGLTVANELGESVRSRLAVVGATAALALLLPLGAVLATPVAALPPSIVAGFFAFGLIALLYLVTEELLVEAHQTPDRPWVTAMFFVGFLAILVLEELMS
ncbi:MULTISPECIES: transporter [Bradyrhizobium]|uniref:transporter n=1 Tax=Bradyrhizobium TaxID=374 RepID=UPI0004643BF2|nr:MULTISPECIES: transporter [Bradyrhizobium]KIU48630.1 transporter [Bradyrhizobium elkanii]OCX29372.1 transporter [Bradyrhizobium sp. UASWS1016]